METLSQRNGPGTAVPVSGRTVVAMTHEQRSDAAFIINNVSKAYPGVQALDGVSLEGYPGEVLAICGANGAGKSTLAKLLAGQEVPTDGSITIRDYAGQVRSPADAEEAGILLMHQEPLIIDEFTVEENVWLRELSSANRTKPWNLSKGGRAEKTREALTIVGMGDVSLSAPGSTLAPGLRQMLALSRTQVSQHQILLLDETTASTTEEHFKDVEDLVERERAEGVSIVFVSHRMPEVFALADRIAVLRNGKLVDVVRTEETTPDDVMTMMIGEAVSALEAPAPIDGTGLTPVLSVSDLAAGSTRGVSFEVFPGEIVGIYGLVGSGRSSVGRSITGQQERLGGDVSVHGKAVSFKDPRAALRGKVAYLTEDRRREGFVHDFTNGENMTLSTLDHFSTFGVINVRNEQRRTRELTVEYQVKGGPQALTSTLSGGNQQKVCIAKWLEADPDLVVLDEPTKGIDVGARLNIYQIARGLAESGKGLVVITSEAEEALMLCNRILIMRDGRLVNEFFPAESTTDDLIRSALGGENE
ncbi:sugar ABC transporter ATP-binding protein [Lysinibacter cavernae]|uniref:ABC-type sugar transport system ATPase subunit n=1 Tax=Lysinibacter cavernae TaxID=1640652 RepID=A0A7X5R0Y2_9MICO|nr:sugar ABC transporter ATP-binding protein [Lysinibacter cavernae]NIH53599.1 ABC-type sugar transport system ATPase subunit [Lysinibacter cavernae]